LGGAGTLIGPVLGAFVVVFTQTFASSLIGGGNWVYVLGGLYIVVAIYLPGGIMARLPSLIPALIRGKTWLVGLRAADAKRSSTRRK
jgi:ABC-type branched-subunit amino acid transport system permease subunit